MVSKRIVVLINLVLQEEDIAFALVCCLLLALKNGCYSFLLDYL